MRGLKIRVIPGPYRDLISEFLALLKEEFKDNIISAVLFGSVAKGKERKDSDVDICLVFKTLPASRHKRTLLIFPILKALRGKNSYNLLYNKGYAPDISPILYTVKEIQDTKPFFLDMAEAGIILLDDGTFRKKIEEVRQRMKELGTKKIILQNGDYYWVLKPGLRISEEVSI